MKLMQHRELPTAARRKLPQAAVYLAAALALAPLQAAETRQERGKRVVYEALQALGGEAFQRMEDRLETGRAYNFYNRELSGLAVAKIYTRYLAPTPGKVALRERQGMGKKEDVYFLFREEGAYEVTFRGARPFADERFAAYQDSTLRNILYILKQRLNEPGLAFYAQDSDFFEHRPVEIVDITDADNRTITVYFDQSSKLPVRQVFKRRNPQFKDFDTEVTIFSKYREVAGVKWPWTILRERNGEKIFEMYVDSMEINKNLTDDLFSLPLKTTVLPKPK